MRRSYSAPSWAIPFLAAYLVATAKRHYLRHLPQSDFHRLARACDVLLLASTAPVFFVALFLLPTAPGFYLLIGVSAWGIVLTLVVGRRVAIERRRRRRAVKLL
jgi:glycine/D-amino acid oxidase-like deaminating enzyme